MTNSNPNPVDERLRADLRSVLQRDPDALRNADHLRGLLADLAPDMPAALRNACVAVARSNATSWLTQTPPYSEEQVVNWLRSQYPDVQPDAARQAVAAFAALSAGNLGGVGDHGAGERTTPVGAAVGSPVFDEPTVAGTVEQPLAPPPAVAPPPGPGPLSPPTGPLPQFPPPVADRPPATNMMTEMPQHPSLPPQQGGWVAPPPPPPPPSRKLWLIVAVVAVLLIGGGVGAWFLLKGSSDTKLAAPKNVSAKLAGSSIVVTWQAVPNADHYVVSDTRGSLSDQRTDGTSATFPSGATENHAFVVEAFTKDDKGGDKSQAQPWTGVPAGPKDVTVSAAGNALNISWSAVPGASTYSVKDLDSSASYTANSTSTSVPDSVYTAHHFQVSAVRGGVAGIPTVQAWTPNKALSAAEATLAYKLPTDMVQPGSCVSSFLTDSSKPYVSAVISCSPANVTSDGPKNLYVDQINDGDYQSFVDTHFGTNLPHKAGCDDSYPDAGTRWTWVDTGTNKTQGDEFCFYNASRSISVFSWSYYQQNIVIQIEGTYPTTRTGLHNWWSNSDTTLK